MNSDTTITDLARLFLETQKPYGEIPYGASATYEAAFDTYCESHPHLKEAYPDEAYRKTTVAVVVRSFAKKMLEDEAIHREGQEQTADPSI